MGSSEEKKTEDYKIYDRRSSFVDQSHPSNLVASDNIKKQNGKNLIFSIEGHPFFGDVWANSAKILKATDHIWSETKIHGQTSVTGGGGYVSTDYAGRVSGSIHPVDVSTSLSSHSQKKFQTNIWYALDSNPSQEIAWNQFPLLAREGHTLLFVYGMIEGFQPFPVKVINRSTGNSFGMGDHQIKSKVYDLALSIVEESYSRQPRRSFLSRIFRPPQQIPVINVNDLVNEIFNGFYSLVEEKY